MQETTAMTFAPTRRGALAVTLGFAAGASLPRPAWAETAPALRQPMDPPLLTVSGRIRAQNQGDAAVFDRAMLEELGLAGFTTTSPWFDGPVRFEGVPMARLMEAVGARGERVTAIALNDYSTDIPISDFARFGVLLAMRRDGKPLRASDKGPLFIIYPFDSSAELRARQYYSRSAWSVAQLIVR
jgi:hypothetical protein